MYRFTGVLKNELRPEPGVNITIKGLEEVRLILAPTGPWHEFDKEQTNKTLSFTLSPSSGTTEGRAVTVEIENGTEKITANPNNWEITLTASSEAKAKAAKFDLAVVYVYDDEPEEEGKK